MKDILLPLNHRHIPIKLAPHHRMLPSIRGIDDSLMHEVIDFPCSNNLISVRISPTSQASFQKYGKKAIVETCLPWCFQRLFRRTRREEEHRVLVRIVGISPIRTSHFPCIASIHENHFLLSFTLSHNAQYRRVIQKSIVTHQSTRHTMTTKV